MRQCGRIQTECRHKCMELVHKLIPCISGIKETKEYFQIRLNAETDSYFLGRFEGSVEKKDLLKNSLANFKTLPELSSTGSGFCYFQLSFVSTWLAMLIAPLDCYSWVFGERLMQPACLFASNKSCIWTSLEYFIDNVVNYDLAELIKRVDSKNEQVKKKCIELFKALKNKGEKIIEIYNDQENIY